MGASAVSLKEVFGRALELADPAERARYLDQACGGDAGLRAEAEALLAAHDRAGSFLAGAAAPDRTADEQPAGGHPGEVIGPYTLREPLGEGGMGLVFVAEQQSPVRRKVALKVLKPGMDSRQVVARFEAERQALALMDHPHIARVFDGGATPSGRPYFVMELVKGVPITQFCDEQRLTPRQRLGLFADVCRAVQHAHTKGVIHRDIKPSNVLVTSHDGRPVAKVIDFGIAKAVGQQLTDKTVYTQLTQLVGTPLYMSPEQAGQSGLDVDTRTDVYALGVLLYELLTGTTPFDQARFRRVGFDEMRRIIREEEPPRPSTRVSTLGRAASTVCAQRRSDPRRLSRLFRGELDWVVMKCLEKDRNRRYETAGALARDVERYLADEPVQARPPSAAYRLRKFVRRNRVLVSAAAAAGLVAAAGLATVLLLQARSNRELREANEREGARFDLAMKAIRAFHTGASEDVLLRQSRFKELRNKLLGGAADFYAEMEGMLQGQSDARSRRALGSAYYELGKLTDKIGSKARALEVHRQGLAVRRELASRPGADAEDRLDVARSLLAVAWLQHTTGDSPGALASYEEARGWAEGAAAPGAPPDQAGSVLATAHNGTGIVLTQTGKPAESLAAYQQARAIQQQLADANPAATQPRSELANTLHNIGWLLSVTGKPQAALEALREALALRQALADAGPTVVQFRSELARSHHTIGWLLSQTGRPQEALASYEKALAVQQQLADAHPTHSGFQSSLADTHNSMGNLLLNSGQPQAALAAFGKALELYQGLAGADPKDPDSRRRVGMTLNNIGEAQTKSGLLPEAVAALERARDLHEGLAKAHPTVTDYRGGLAFSLSGLGRAQQRAGRAAAAAASLRRAVELRGGLPTLSLEARYDLACNQALLAALADDPASGLTAAEGRDAADKAVDQLRRAVAAGYAGLDKLRADPDLAALRPRPDFRQLVQALEARTKG
jgi:serine/threonine protein kinase